MMPMPLTWTSASSGTMISMPPMTAHARIVTCGPENRASRRSSWPPPQNATTLNVSGTTHGPLRSNPLMMPTPTVEVGVPPTMRSVRATAGVAEVAGRSRVMGSRSPYVFAA
ncbi:MAG: hypothetical protein JWP48_881, partial [Actinoallomurus sp.]|nr:hypothetical protein [Actinoallomurus sp.]